jgi:excisionase family DNA binding protein
MEPDLLRIEEVAQRTGLSRSKTYELAASGDLPTVRVGRSVRVRRSALNEWLRRLPDRGGREADEAPSLRDALGDTTGSD